MTGLRLQAREQAETMASALDPPASRSPGRPLPTGPCLATDGQKLTGWSRRGPRESVVVDDSLGEPQSGHLCPSQVKSLEGLGLLAAPEVFRAVWEQTYDAS